MKGRFNPKPGRAKRVISHSEAIEIASRFISSHFKKSDRELPRISIPANPERDDDLLINSYIEQQKEKEALLEARNAELLSALRPFASLDPGARLDANHNIQVSYEVPVELNQGNTRVYSEFVGELKMADIKRAHDVLSNSPPAPDNGQSKPNWWWDDCDPDVCGDSPAELLHDMVDFEVRLLHSSYEGPSKYAFLHDGRAYLFDNEDEAKETALFKRGSAPHG